MEREFSPIDNNRVSALRVLEYVVYIVVLLSFFVEVISVISFSNAMNIETSVRNRKTLATLFVAGIFFMVVIRSYIDLQMIDYEGAPTDRLYKFVSENRGWGGGVERLLRLGIAIVVILSPKSGLSLNYAGADSIPEAVFSSINGIYGFIVPPIVGIFESGGFGDSQSTNNHIQAIYQFHDFIEHYGAIFLILGILFIFHDITNLLLLKSRGNEDSDHTYKRGMDKPKENRDDFYSMMAFLGVRQEIRRENGDSAAHYVSSLQKNKSGPKERLKNLAEKGRFIRIYFYSPRLYERVAVILASLICYISSRSEADLISVMVLMLLLVFLALAARRDFKVASVATDLFWLVPSYIVGRRLDWSDPGKAYDSFNRRRNSRKRRKGSLP